MCGIVGYVGTKKRALQVLLKGLKALEYRGYDSSGVYFFDGKKYHLKKRIGKLENLEKELSLDLPSSLGIGHTRWATHGSICEENAHPHKVGSITLVHNGIIENMEQLKGLVSSYELKSDTDSEVIAALLDFLYRKHKDMLKAMKEMMNLVEGSYALGIILENDPETLYAVRNISPLILGLGEEETFLASDIPAILAYTKNYILLENQNIAVLKSNEIQIYDCSLQIKEAKVHTFSKEFEEVTKDGFDHFMQKEIHEEPIILKNLCFPYLKEDLASLPDLSKYDNIEIIGCGSAMYAGLLGKYFFETYAHIPVTVTVASEYRYQTFFEKENTLTIFISQSGETADTLSAFEQAKKHKLPTLAIVNVFDSSLARYADAVLYTNAGFEIAVATTKAYMAQVALLSLLALKAGLQKETISKETYDSIKNEFLKLPNTMKTCIEREDYEEIAQQIFKKEHLFYIGRLSDYALCLEGSLKLKEISYLHSEAYQAGELKHGTISLIEEHTPVIAITTDSNIAKKTISNMKEVKTRKADVYWITSEDIPLEEHLANKTIILPNYHTLLRPLLAMIPLQLIAYETAKLRGCDIDKPRNLAKSVTVE